MTRSGQQRLQGARRQALGNIENVGPGACARADQDGGIGLAQASERRVGHMRQARHQHRAIAGQRGAGGDDIDVLAEPPHRLVPAQAQLGIPEIGPLRLDLDAPGGFVIEHQSHRRLGGRAQRAGVAQFGRHAQGLLAARRSRAVRTVQPGMHLLLCERALPPAEIAHHFGAVRERLPAPQPHHPRLRHRVPRRPVHRAGLLLHDPEPAASDAAIEVVVKAAMSGCAVSTNGARSSSLSGNCSVKPSG